MKAMWRGRGTRLAFSHSMTIHFIIPGDIDTPTGGYRYDRAILDEWRKAGIAHELISLEGAFPFPTHSDVEECIAKVNTLSGARSIVVDGLAGGASAKLMEALSYQAPLTALIHHPLCLENGLSVAEAIRLKGEEQKGLAHTSQVITTSKATAKTVHDLFGYPQNRIRTVLPGVERGPISQPSADKPVRLICIGSVIERKGHRDLIAALRNLTELGWVLDCYGATEFDPSLYRELTSMVEAAELTTRIRFHGAVGAEELEAAYGNADVFVLASHYEGYGMAYAEAIVRGLPVLGTTAGAIPDTVPEACGILIEPGNQKALEGALQTMIEEPETRKIFHEAAVKHEPDFPSWTTSARDFAEHMSRV